MARQLEFKWVPVWEPDGSVCPYCGTPNPSEAATTCGNCDQPVSDRLKIMSKDQKAIADAIDAIASAPPTKRKVRRR